MGTLGLCGEMIRQHGDDAGVYAAMKADALFEAGEDEGAATWRLIIHRIEQMRSSPSRAAN